MYAQPAYTARFKHKLFLKDGARRYMGDLTSYSDSANVKISSELNMTPAKLEAYPAVQAGSCFSFIMAVDPSSEASQYLAYLKKSPHRGALMYLDSSGSEAFLQPLGDHETFLINGMQGFRCFVVEMKRPTPVPVAASVPVKTEQDVAASHYNDLVRQKNTRHLSHIFHMRNLNNVIKTQTIEAACSMVKMDYVNNGGKVPGGLSVIDFGCGMGGDMAKWFQNKSGKCSVQFIVYSVLCIVYCVLCI
ncbi:hypothetical protein B484DRAFT_187091, partial [Ochromonadaceae sp. CCMP2298]